MNEDRKDFNRKLHDRKDMPKIVTLDDKAAERWGGTTMVIAPPIDYDTLIRTVPAGSLVTTAELRTALAKKYHADVTCPLTAGIFVNICAWASYQRDEDITPYWRVVRPNGELNPKFPEYPHLQKKKLEEEGFQITEKKEKYFVADFKAHIADMR
ncbi:MAG TPA: MGMT family protein [Methanocorpusculum sp.]|nr:MGMT family protein [Methanocorpusculum sp.]